MNICIGKVLGRGLKSPLSWALSHLSEGIKLFTLRISNLRKSTPPPPPFRATSSSHSGSPRRSLVRSTRSTRPSSLIVTALLLLLRATWSGAGQRTQGGAHPSLAPCGAVALISSWSANHLRARFGLPCYELGTSVVSVAVSVVFYRILHTSRSYTPQCRKCPAQSEALRQDSISSPVV